MWHDSFICVPHMDSYVCHIWIHMCATYVAYPSHVTWLIHMCAVNFSYISPFKFVIVNEQLNVAYLSRVTWLIHMCAEMLRGTHMKESCHYVAHIWMSHVTTWHTYEWVVSHDSFICVPRSILGSELIFETIPHLFKRPKKNPNWDVSAGMDSRCAPRVVARMNELWHIWLSHGMYECVMSHTHKAWHIREMSEISHGTYEWVMAHTNESWHIWMSHGTFDRVKAHLIESWHIWSSHVTYEWVISHMIESCHIYMSHGTYEWVMAHLIESWHIWSSHGTYEWVMSRMNESYHIWSSHVTYTWVTCQWTRVHEWHDAYVTWLIHMCHDSFICAMTHSYVTWPPANEPACN